MIPFFFFLLLHSLSYSLLCTVCPPSPSDCIDHCNGDICYIVVNAYFNGTLSAGCITLKDQDKLGFNHDRKDCNRDVIHDRTVCVCNTNDNCNSPKTPIAQFDFIDYSILDEYDLQYRSTKEPSFVLPTDEPTEEPSIISSTHIVSSTVQSISSTTTTVSSTPTSPSPSASSSTFSSTPFTPSIPSTSTPPSSPSIHSLSTHHPPLGPYRKMDEEGLIEVKSSVFINSAKNQSKKLPVSSTVIPNTTTITPPLATPNSTTVSPVSSPSSSTVIHSKPLPTDDTMELSGFYRSKVLPTDTNDDEGLVVVKSAMLNVKENVEESKIMKNTVEKKNTVYDKSTVVEKDTVHDKSTVDETDAVEIDMVEEIDKIPNRRNYGEGSIEETEVSSGVQIGGSPLSPSSSHSSTRPLLSSRSRNDKNINSSNYYSLVIYYILFLFIYSF